MKRVIKEITYRHEDHMSQIRMEVQMQGVSVTDLTIWSTTTGDTTHVVIEDDFGGSGIAVLASNEGVTEMEALGAIAGILSDLTNAETLNKRARSGLANHVLTEMAKGN